MSSLQSVFGLAVMLGLAWVLSEDRRAVPRRLVVSGLALAFVLAAAFLKIPALGQALARLNGLLDALQSATTAGTSFVFGYLGGGAAAVRRDRPGTSFVLAFQALPLVLVVSALSALLFHWRVLPLVVRASPGCCGGPWASAARSACGGGQRVRRHGRGAAARAAVPGAADRAASCSS